MKKQYFTTEISSLLNPPLLSKFNQLQKDSSESVYASKKYPLGRTKLSKISAELFNTKFGISTEQGDSASVVIFPSNIRLLHSVYEDKFRPPSSPLLEVPPAGLKAVGKDLTDNTGKDMKEILTEVIEDKPTVNHNNNMKSNTYDNRPPHYISKSCVDYNHLVENKKSETHYHKPSLLDVLWKLLKANSYLNPVEFSSFLKAYVQNFPRTFTFVDLQKLLKNFSAYIPLPALENVLGEYDVFEDGVINTEAFLKALRKGFYGTKTNLCSDRTFLLSYPCDDSIDHFKTTSSIIGNHKSTVSIQPAGITTTCNSIRRPKLRSISDFAEYEDIRNGSCIIQPSLFEQYGVYGEDLGILRPKEQIKSILYRSGILFNDEMFNIVWNKVSERGRASIGNIWNTLKNLCLTENKLF